MRQSIRGDNFTFHYLPTSNISLTLRSSVSTVIAKYFQSSPWLPENISVIRFFWFGSSLLMERCKLRLPILKQHRGDSDGQSSTGIVYIWFHNHNRWPYVITFKRLFRSWDFDPVLTGSWVKLWNWIAIPKCVASPQSNELNIMICIFISFPRWDIDVSAWSASVSCTDNSKYTTFWWQGKIKVGWLLSVEKQPHLLNPYWERKELAVSKQWPANSRIKQVANALFIKTPYSWVEKMQK